MWGPDPLQVTGVRLWEGTGISLAKFIQTDREPDPQGDRQIFRGSQEAPRKAKGRGQGETLREGLEHLLPVGVWKLFPGASFSSCSRLCPSGLRIAFLGTISELASPEVFTTLYFFLLETGFLVVQAGLNS